jgi:type II secretory pathway pseudopilin PulG
MFGRPTRKFGNMETIKFLLATLLKRAKHPRETEGFTLIELLVGLILAFLIITPLLGLAVNLIDTDRKEQAKATSEQELQAAADFITRDLQQAIFIYNAQGLNNITTASPPGIKNQIPPVAKAPGCEDSTKCVPVLAFWKRRPVKDAVPRDSIGNTSAINCDNAGNSLTVAQGCDDTFVYSLVGYYLILGDDVNKTWSKTARIARFEITDGVKYLGGKEIYEATDPKNRQELKKDKGFAMFTLDKDVTAAMNTWKKGTEAYTQPVQVLADYIDREEIPAAERTKLCPTETDLSNKLIWTLTSNIPSYGFYACVNQKANIARFYLRGNARARIESRDKHLSIKYSNSTATYFPTVSAEVKTVGKLVQ